MNWRTWLVLSRLEARAGRPRPRSPRTGGRVTLNPTIRVFRR